MTERNSHIHDDIIRIALADYRAALTNEIDLLKDSHKKAELLAMIANFGDDISERVLKILNPSGDSHDDIPADEPLYSYDTLKAAIEMVQSGENLN